MSAHGELVVRPFCSASADRPTPTNFNDPPAASNRPSGFLPEPSTSCTREVSTICERSGLAASSCGPQNGFGGHNCSPSIPPPSLTPNGVSNALDAVTSGRKQDTAGPCTHRSSRFPARKLLANVGGLFGAFRGQRGVKATQRLHARQRQISPEDGYSGCSVNGIACACGKRQILRNPTRPVREDSTCVDATFPAAPASVGALAAYVNAATTSGGLNRITSRKISTQRQQQRTQLIRRRNQFPPTPIQQAKHTNRLRREHTFFAHDRFAFPPADLIFSDNTVAVDGARPEALDVLSSALVFFAGADRGVWPRSRDGFVGAGKSSHRPPDIPLR